jgi:hypothetical protein
MKPRQYKRLSCIPDNLCENPDVSGCCQGVGKLCDAFEFPRISGGKLLIRKCNYRPGILAGAWR